MDGNDNDNWFKRNITLKNAGLISGTLLIAYAATQLPNGCSCSGNHNKKNNSEIKDTSGVIPKYVPPLKDTATTINDTTKIIKPKIIKPKNNKRIKNDSIDDKTEVDEDTQDNTKKITIVDDRRYTSGNSTGSNKYNAGDPCVYQHPTDKDLYMRYSGTAGKKKGGSWTENHAGRVINGKIINTNTRDNIFKDWTPIGNMDVIAFYEINGKNYYINGRPGKETMSDSAVNARYKQNVKNYDKSYIKQSGFKPQRGDK